MQQPWHRWGRVLNVEGIHGYDVDVTGVGDGDGDGDGDVSEILVWRMDGRHPAAGVYRTMRVVPAVPPAG